MPKVSIIMSIYMEPLEWIRQSIDSILNQSYRDFEFIIINDNPDRKENRLLIDEYISKDSRFVFIENEINIGLTKSLNKGLSIAKGEYIARMDADDISRSRRLEYQVNYLDSHSDCDLCFVNYSLIDERGTILTKPVLKSFDIADMFLKDVIAHPSVMFRNNINRIRTPLYNEDYKNAQDYELWATLILNDCNLSFIPQEGLLYRISTNQISNSQHNTQTDNGRKIRKKLIVGYLNKIGIPVSESHDALDLYKLLQHTKSGKNSILRNIKYIILFTLSESQIRFALFYLFNKEVFVFKNSCRMSARVLLAGIMKNRWVLYRY